MQEKTLKRLVKLSYVILALVIVAVICGAVVLKVAAYKPDSIAYLALESTANVTVKVEEDDSAISFIPNNPIAGIVFYQGAAVETEAYAPLLRKLADKGILSVAVKMPLNMACFNGEAANWAMDLHPQIEHWYICGHSLGGAMASLYINRFPQYLEGIIFLGAFSSVPLRDDHFGVLSIYGSEDAILDMRTYNLAKKDWPEHSEEVIIEGANHANFGNYGDQKGDGEATITRTAQQLITADLIYNFVLENIARQQ